MITDREIETVGAENDLSPQAVEKDYVHGWLLGAIYSRPWLANALVLKGGNGLRKGYFPSTRFSKDLDFSASEGVDQESLERELHQAIDIVQRNTGVRFLDTVVVKDKNLTGVEAIEARLYFKGFYNEEPINLKAQLDITQFDRIILPVQVRPIIHPYSDAHALTQSIRCQKAEEILASKLTTLLHRRKASDLFDLVFGILRGGYDVSRREVISTFLKKSIFEQAPEQARSELLQTPVGELADFWETLPVPRMSIFGFDMVLAQFPVVINALFDAIVEAAAATLGTARGRPVSGTFAPRSAPLFFGNRVREVIISAGQSRRMVELTYDGYRRLVEPYRLAYQVRKDGEGHEYFWGYDTSGGRSGERSMKSFFASKIMEARMTDRTYSPRYPVEF